MAGEWLHTSSIFLAAAVVTVPLAQRFGLGAVLGYLLAGIAIGPWGLQLISDVDAILHFSEFGVVLLLFLIGLELNPNKLWKMRKPIIGLGGSQVVLTSCVITAAMMFYGLAWQVSVVIGMGLALSSTAIALRVIEERKLSASESGQSGFAVLLFQDIAVIPMLAVLPVLAGGASGNWMDGLWILAGVIGIFTLGHFLLRPLFSYVVKSGARELFTVAALLLVIGVSAAMKQLGLSMALGAFLAGVLLAESEFRHELEVAIEPFKGLLLGLFFIAVGMSVNLGLLLQYPFEILVAVMILVSSKGFLLYGLARLFGTQAKARSQMAMILSQGGEFAFVLFTAAQMEGLLSRELTAFLLVVVSLSMMTTPLLLIAQDKWFTRTLNNEDEIPQSDFTHATQPKVIIAGFGRFGQIVGRLLFANKIKLTILESDPSQIRLLRKFGYKVYYGDATQVELLRAAGAEKAEAIVICKTDPQKVMEIVALCKQHFPHLKILARARSRVEAYELLNEGVDHFSRETFYGALDLGRQTLTSLGMHSYQAKRAESHFKKLDVAMLKELLPLHSDDKALASKAKAARIELEEIFGLEMESERSNQNDWD
ncbi:glutathione-regulated potassium-efflux system protein KefB [Aliivibrio sp. S4TY2]|uniref:glutathione-regulated potassium-efflux system protein KefB n=1 Tax=unclassified Aliivibrio TaxID=2645654 RepID=UPI0023797DF6|nr:MULTISPECIES: glutathione-regulated potassium-efflux system protein KefB [unclassified Aliivibrio]MDD9155950.1 glutathione-regulated potassium-efflux system protein KefB [Aliivibrio sp. S4TY2]MDD9159659.1 glutathione-regulated potassium-efflux system protein KefB [Aliivibrio sp. S4TY1]MDD9163659.1 glutathione-regulated potassium-efflux system protein KefB [Aliivibrio sp. S4MY2]MDD9167659.1 glutathione-regulated potassium-efflux system protein KefB [Aliivibrio sp. S4MY4]MDD9185677.1 glutathi